MNLSVSDLRQLAEEAVAAAVAAGQLIARSRPAEVQHKTGGQSLASQVVTETDRASEALILDRLTPTRDQFDLGLLTEEQDDDGSRFTADYFWCIDPLDGTLSFIEGAPGYAVSIALVARDGRPVIGVIYDPVEEVVLHAIAGVGAFRNEEPWLPEPSGTGAVLSIFADRSLRLRGDAEAILAALGRSARDLGLDGAELQSPQGGVLNACGVLGRPPGCYLKFPTPRGGGSLWDFAATACLFREVGAVVSDMHGAPLDLNRADGTSMGHRGVLYATDERVATLIRTRGLGQT